MFTLNKRQNFMISIVIVCLWVLTSIAVVNLESTEAQIYEPLPPNIWLQAHLFNDGWGSICSKECDAYDALGNEQEMSMRFPAAWMTVNWYYYLFNRRYCQTTGVCLEPLPSPQYSTG